MAKCLYFRQSMSSNAALGLGGGQKDAENPDNDSKPPPGLVPAAVPTTSSIGASPTRLTSAPTSSSALVNSSDLSSLSLGDLPSNEAIFAGMELDLNLQLQHQQQQQQTQRFSVQQTTPSSAQRQQLVAPPGLFRTQNVMDNALSVHPQVPTTTVTSSASILRDWNPYAETPSLAEAILENDFLVSKDKVNIWETQKANECVREWDLGTAKNRVGESRKAHHFITNERLAVVRGSVSDRVPLFNTPTLIHCQAEYVIKTTYRRPA